MVADTVFDTVFDIVKDMNWNALTQRRAIADQYQFRSRSQDQSFQYLKFSKRQCKRHNLPSEPEHLNTIIISTASNCYSW